MKLFYTISFCIINLVAFSQSNAWTKAERTTLYNDCISEMKKYETPNTEQREKISICCLSEITKKYSKSAFDELLDVEAKHVIDDFIIKCSKSLSINIYYTPIRTEISNDDLIK